MSETQREQRRSALVKQHLLDRFWTALMQAARLGCGLGV